MPYKDPKRKTKQMKAWREDVMARGYGKWLYARRKLRFDDAERFRDALERITVADTLSAARATARKALMDSIAAEKRLGPWKGRKT